MYIYMYIYMGKIFNMASIEKSYRYRLLTINSWFLLHLSKHIVKSVIIGVGPINIRYCKYRYFMYLV